MHNEHGPKEKSSIFLFIPVTVVAAYLVYLVLAAMFNIGAQHGTISATYRGPVKVDEGVQVYDHRRLIRPTTELVDLGNRVYRANCASCHGAEGHGDGAAGQNLAIKPRSFDGPLNQWKNGASVLNMYVTLEKGLGGMPNFPALNPEQKYAVIHYIHEEFMGGNFPADSEDMIASLPAPSAGGGAVNINPYANTRVPVQYAIDKLIREAQTEKQ